MATALSSPARLKFWGVRGSIPVPGPATLKYGGNTSCIELRADNEIIVCDAGTGIRGLGLALEAEFGSRPITIALLITHVHWDHIQGFPFFIPAYNDKNSIRVFGFDGAEAGLAEILKEQMATPFFPVKLGDLPGRLYIKKLDTMDFNIGKVRVRAKFVNHPGVCVGYRFDTSTGSVAYLPDNEPYDGFKLHAVKTKLLSPEQTQKRAEIERAELVDFLSGCDVLILDTQYTDDEYKRHIGWGHGSLSACTALAVDAKVRKLVLFHHDPDHDDQKIDEMLKQARALIAKKHKTLEIDAAREGDEYLLRG